MLLHIQVLDIQLAHNNSDDTWVLWQLKSMATWLFIQKFVQANNKENIKGLQWLVTAGFSSQRACKSETFFYDAIMHHYIRGLQQEISKSRVPLY